MGLDGATDTSIGDDWYQRSFGAVYPVLYAHRSVEAAAPEAAFAAERLGLQSGDRVLDLCCGNGRHMVHLLRHTPRVVGLDYSLDLLSLASEQLGDGAGLVRGDMRALPFGMVFDAVTNFFTSFGYFGAPEENLAVVREVARVLKPMGRFFIDYLNPAHVAATLVPETVREHEGYQITERRWIDGERRRVNKATVVSRDGRMVGRWGESVRLYEEAEFRALLREGGLEIERLFGDYDGAPPSDDRPRLIAVGHRA